MATKGTNFPNIVFLSKKEFTDNLSKKAFIWAIRIVI